MQFIDTHCHLDFPDYDEDRPAVIERAQIAGCKAIICNGIDQASNEKIIALAKKYAIIKASLGYYPSHLADVSEEEFSFALDFIRANTPVSLGEIGLDYKEVEETDRALVEKRFLQLLDLAEELDLPVIIHSRKAEERCIELLENKKLKVIMHCFSGKKRLVERVAKNGWTFSIPATVVRTEHFQNIIHNYPLSQIVTETDGPYLSPFRDKRNEPAFIIESIKKIAEIKGMTSEEVGNQIFMNYQKLFL